MRILVTGINGFIGTHLARELQPLGHTVQGLSIGCTGPIAGAEVFETDILDGQALAQTVARCAPDVIVHLAGQSHVGESWLKPGETFRVNTIGTGNLLRAVGRRRIIFASSAEVYGLVPENEQPISEERQLDPRSPYAMTKACAEQIALDHGAIIVRAFNIIGSGQSRRFALPSFASQLAAIGRGEQEPKLRVGDLSPRRDFLHVDDAAAGYRTLIEQGEPGRAYNLASGRALSIAEALGRLREISGIAAEVEPEEARRRPADIPLLVGDNRRLERLGWAPRYDLDRALGELWRDARDSD